MNIRPNLKPHFTPKHIPMDMRRVDIFNPLVMPEPNSGCWFWVGHCSTYGYGVVEHSSGKYKAHRVAYVQAHGEVPEHLVLDHLCRMRSCVNPDHLEPVTVDENWRRGTHRNAVKTHCKRGHSLSAGNLVHQPNGTRWCRECRRMHQRARKKMLRSKRGDARAR